MPHFFIIHHTYTTVIIALCNTDSIVGQQEISSKDISKLFVYTIDILLSKQGLTLNALAFIAVNTGPGPFATLRSVIASVNGLHLVNNIPLISLDGLKGLFFQESKQDTASKKTVALFNAYNKDVYFMFKHNGIYESGYKKIAALLSDLQSKYHNKKICFVGNAAILYETHIKNICTDNGYIISHVEHATVATLASYAYTQWKLAKFETFLSARYIKTYK